MVMPAWVTRSSAIAPVRVEPARWRPVVLVVAAAGLLASGLLPWFDTDVGPSASGFRLAGLVLAFGDLGPPWPATWIGVVWFVVPFTGALTLVVVGWTGGDRRRAAVWVPALGSLVVAAGVLRAGAASAGGAARGPLLASVCAAAIVAISLLPHRRRRTDRPRGDQH